MSSTPRIRFNESPAKFLNNAQEAMSLELIHVSDHTKQQKKRSGLSSKKKSLVNTPNNDDDIPTMLPRVSIGRVKRQQNSFYPLTMTTHQMEHKASKESEYHSNKILPSLKIKSGSPQKYNPSSSVEAFNNT